jgi:hypothetical protein
MKIFKRANTRGLERENRISVQRFIQYVQNWAETDDASM